MIDRDIRLFLPNEYEYILYGGNFLFSKRFYEIAKRTKSIKRIDYTGRLDSSDRIKSLISYYNCKTFIFTSELLDQLDKSELNQLYYEVLNNKTTKFIFIDIGESATIALDIIRKLDWDKDLIFSFGSFLTYVLSNVQENPLYSKEFKVPNDVYLADDLIDNLLNVINNVGLLYADKNLRSKEDVIDYVTHQSKAALNIIYRKKPYELVKGKSVAEWRMLLGKSLSQNINRDTLSKLDLILPVPETGKAYAQGISAYTSIPYVEALYKKVEVGRSFDIQDSNTRKEFIKNKLGLIKSLVKGKVIGVVDEAIFTGMTLKQVCQLLIEAEAKEIHLLIPTPECRNKCTFNMQPSRSFLSENYSKGALKEYFNVEDVIFQNFETFENIMEESGFNYLCCFENE